MSGEDFTLKECLAEFLKGGLTEMPVVEVRILSRKPLKVTDDDMHYLEIPALADKIQNQTKGKGQAKLVLVDWSFLVKKVPNSQDYYLDVEADTYRVIENGRPLAETSQDDVTNIMEDVDIK